MKEIRIVCIGKIKEKYLSDGIDFYLKEIRKKYPASVIECSDEPAPDGISCAMEEKIKLTEGRRVLSKLQDEDHVIALCIDGKRRTTAEWKKRFPELASRAQGSLVFVIGGSLGLSQDVVKRADEKLSFSRMTFPHQMMRMILCGQIAAWVSGSHETGKLCRPEKSFSGLYRH